MPRRLEPSQTIGKREKWLCGLAAAHLLLVALGSMGFDFRSAAIPPTELLRWYTAMTGANNRYSFFAPGVETPTRVAFLMRDDDTGREWLETLEFGATPESNLRLATVAFALPLLDEADQDLMFRSLAATMLKQCPDADSVEVRYQWLGVEERDALLGFPNMSEYRAGQRAHWVTLSATEPLRIEDAR